VSRKLSPSSADGPFEQWVGHVINPQKPNFTKVGLLGVILVHRCGEESRYGGTLTTKLLGNNFYRQSMQIDISFSDMPLLLLMYFS
jgi:hypothetical protein